MPARSDSRFKVQIRNWDKHQREMRGEGKRRRRRDWIALSTDLCRDPDVLALTIEQRWLWIALLAHAGRVGVEFELSASTARVLFSLRPGWKAAKDLERLQELGFIDLEVLVMGEAPKPKPKPAPKPKPETVPYPDGLNIKAWEQYMQYRRDNNYRKYKPKYAKQTMRKWAQHSAEAQQKAVDATIENGWQGAFPERFSDKQSLSPDQEDAKARADVTSLSRLMQINQNPGEPWEQFAARVMKANERRIAAQETR